MAQSSQKTFKILYDGIGAYEDEELDNETFTVILEKDTVVQGTFINDNVVLLGDPYNVYCSSVNVEALSVDPPDDDNNKQHEYDSTVVIHIEDMDDDIQPLQPKHEEPKPQESEEAPDSSHDYVVVDDQKFESLNPSDAATSEFETINTSDAQSSDPSNPPSVGEDVNPPSPPPIPPPAPAVAVDEDVNEMGYDVDNEDNDENEFEPIIKRTTTTGMPPPPASPSYEPVGNGIEPDIQPLDEEALRGTNISVMALIPPPVPDTITPNESTQNTEEPAVIVDGENDENELEDAIIARTTTTGMPPPPPASPSYEPEIQVQPLDQEALPPPVPKDAIEIASAAQPPPVPHDVAVEYEEVELETTTAAMPPPVPQDAVQKDDNEEEYEYVDEEDMTEPEAYGEDMDIVQELNEEYVPSAEIAALTTGSTLEDLDNLLRMYRRMQTEKEREYIYKEFWEKYNVIVTKKSYLLLQIPSIVRGFLEIMSEDMEPYRRDRIMKNVLSRNGLLEEPAYIDKRYLFSYFVQYEIFNYMRWWFMNCGSVQAWMFFFLMLLMIAEVLHIGVDFGNGNPWRAVLMECLIPLTFVAAIQFVNTPFTANILRTLIENKCAALCTVYGRVSLNLLIIFFCLGSLEIADAILLFCALLVAIWTVIVFVSFSRLKHASNYVRIATGTSKTLQEKFAFSDENKDGVLDADELRSFFKAFNQIVPKWQIDLMISQYDVHRDNGLRFDALNLWFQKLPVDHTTRMNLLASRSAYDANVYEHAAGIEVERRDRKSSAVGGDGYQITTGKQPQYTEAEKEYMDLFVGRAGTNNFV
eukprot:180021_1